MLGTLRRATAAAGDLLQSGEPALVDLADFGEQIRAAISSIVARWQLLDRSSPYRVAALDEAIALVRAVVQAAGRRGSAAAVSLSLEADLGALVAARGRALLADRLVDARGPAPLRRTADQVGVAAGYLSDLEGGRAGPPSPDMLAKLQRAFGIEVDDVAEARRLAEQLKKVQRQRDARARRLPPTEHPREQARFRALETAVAEDPPLLDLFVAIGNLPKPVWRALEPLVAEFSRSLESSKSSPAGS